eukprot:s363_g39.t1
MMPGTKVADFHIISSWNLAAQDGDEEEEEEEAEQVEPDAGDHNCADDAGSAADPSEAAPSFASGAHPPAAAGVDGDGDVPMPGAASDEPVGAGDDEVMDEPDTKAAFNAMRGEYKNTWSLCAVLFQDKDLQKRLRVVVMCLEPLEKEFFHDVEEQCKGPVALARWAASRARGSWSQCIAETLELFHSPHVYQRLGMLTQAAPTVPDVEPAWVQEDRHWCHLVYNMVIEVASARAWSQCMWSVFLPQLLAGLLSESILHRNSVLGMIKRVGTTLLKAETKTHIPGVRKCLDAIAFHKIQLVREFLKMCQAGNPESKNPDADWSLTDEMVEFAWRLYAGPGTTKYILEDTFGHLRHVSETQNKGRAYMSKPTQWFYSSTAPCLKTAKLPSPEVLYPTFQQCFASQAQQWRATGRQDETFQAILAAIKAGSSGSKQKVKDRHKPGKFPLPPELVNEKALLELDRTWKAAGYKSNRSGTAALLYLTEEVNNDWANAAQCWAGEVYFTFDLETRKRPTWYYNYSVTASNPWKGVPTRQAPPSVSPLGRGGVLEQIGEPMDLLKFGLKTGIWLSAENIKYIFTARGWEYPRQPGKGKSSYKSRRKIDFVERMISKLFPVISAAERKRMIHALCGEGPRPPQDEACDEALLQVIAGLDPENAFEAKGLRKQCFDRLSQKVTKPGSEKQQHASGWTKKHFTPTELRELLPPTEVTVWIKRLPGQSSYVGFYDRCSVTIHLFIVLVSFVLAL